MLGAVLVQGRGKASPFEAFPGLWNCYRTSVQSVLGAQQLLFVALCSTLDARTAALERVFASRQSCSAHTRNFRKDATRFDYSLSLVAKYSLSCLVLDFSRYARLGGPLRSVTMFVFFKDA